MARGLNNFSGAGNVSGPIKFGSTGQGDLACSFMLVMDKKNQQVSTWVRINVYGPLVKICETKLKKGDYLVVEGELMNRQRVAVEAEGDTQILTEVRARDIIFVTSN